MLNAVDNTVFSQRGIIIIPILLSYGIQDKTSSAALAFLNIAGEIDDLVFGITSDDSVFSEYKVTGDAVVLFKNVSIV